MLCAFTPYNDFKVAATYIAGNQFPIGAIFVLLVLATVVNAVLRRARPAAAFSQGELLTVWTLILVASGLPSSGMMRYFIPYMVAPHYYSDDENNWESKIWQDTPNWLKIQDQAAVEAFFRGYPRTVRSISPGALWAGPLFFWSMLALLFSWPHSASPVCFGASGWRTRSSAFPLVTLPILLAEEPRSGRLMGDLLYSPLLWLAVGLTTAVHAFKGLHLLYPSVPDIATYVNVADYLTVRPWDQIGKTELWFFPLVIGITYLLPADEGRLLDLVLLSVLQGRDRPHHTL